MYVAKPIFLRQTELAAASRVVSASSESGLTTGIPVSAAANKGSLRLRSSGVPVASVSLDLALQRGGFPSGLYARNTASTAPTGTPGASLRWRLDGDASTAWRGHVDNGYLTYARQIVVGSGTTDYPQASPARALRNGSLGYVRVRNNIGTISLQFAHKSTRTGAWTTVTIASSGIDQTVRPDFCVLPTGRLLVYAELTTTPTRVAAYYSDDHGATWANWSSDVMVDVASKTLTVATVGDVVCLVTGATPTSGAQTMNIYWSLDGGQGFAVGESVATQGLPALTVAITGQILLAVSDTSNGDVVVYPLILGGGRGTALVTLTISLVAANPTLGFTTHDDGTIWLVYGVSQGGTGHPAGLLHARVSTDNGTDWDPPSGPSGSTRIFDNKADAIGTTRGYTSFTLGSWQGSLVVIGVTDSVAAATDEGQHELWFGGWDPLTEVYREAGTAHDATDYYDRFVYTPTDIPDNLNMTKTDVGAGATVALSANGLNIVTTAANNSYYTAHSQHWAPGSGEGFRFRFVFRVTSGGSVTANDATFFAAISDGANRQWIRLRFSTDAIRLLDNSGTLQTSASVANQFNEHTEVFIAFAHDTSAGAGTVSVWYRIAGSAVWTALASNQAVAEQAGATVESLFFGGDAASIGTDWDVSMLAIGEGAANLYDGFTNPDDLHGRALPASVDLDVRSGVHIGAFGGPGVAADTYDCATTYHWAASNIWLSPRPSCQWRTTADGASANAVFGDGTNHFRLDMAALFGTNVRTVNLQLSASNSPFSSAYSVKMDATVWAGTATANGKGYFRVDGDPFLPHQFRSHTGRRWFLEIAGSTVVEIADNGANEIRATDLADTHGAVALKVFGDRMAALLPSDQTYLYARLLIDSQQTADDHYRLGSLYLGMRHEVTEIYDSGFVDDFPPNVGTASTLAGYVATWVNGPEKHRLRLAWDAIDALSTPYLQRLLRMLRSLQGEHHPVVLWRDPNDVSSLGLYRVKGPPAEENVYGERADALSRLAQIILTEETT